MTMISDRSLVVEPPLWAQTKAIQKLHITVTSDHTNDKLHAGSHPSLLTLSHRKQGKQWNCPAPLTIPAVAAIGNQKVLKDPLAAVWERQAQVSEVVEDARVLESAGGIELRLREGTYICGGTYVERAAWAFAADPQMPRCAG